MKILVKVTREIIERSAMCPGTLSNDFGHITRTSCAVSLAIREIFPVAQVYGFGITLDPDKEIECIDSLRADSYDIHWGTKAPIAVWISNFDKSMAIERYAMQPISFEIDVPDSIIEKIGIGQAYKILSESATLELIEI